MWISFAVVVNPILTDGPGMYSVGKGATTLAGSTGWATDGGEGLVWTGGGGAFGLGCFAGSVFFIGDVGAGRGRGVFT